MIPQELIALWRGVTTTSESPVDVFHQCADQLEAALRSTSTDEDN